MHHFLERAISCKLKFELVVFNCLKQHLFRKLLLYKYQVTYAKCFPWEDRRNGSEFDATAFRASISDWKKTCLLAGNAAKQSYQRALHLSPWQTNIYADIAITVDLISSLEEQDTSDIDVWYDFSSEQLLENYLFFLEIQLFGLFYIDQATSREDVTRCTDPRGR